MELKQIFRHQERELYSDLADLQHRYVGLRDLFIDFVRHFEKPEKGIFPITEVDFRESDIKKPELVAYFCGRKFRFCFDMVDKQGLVCCFVSSVNDKKDADPQELGRFTFNAQGATNIAPPSKRGAAQPLPIDTGASAYGIVASFLIAGCAVPPR